MKGAANGPLKKKKKKLARKPRRKHKENQKLVKLSE